METEKTINMGNCEIQKINSLEKFLSNFVPIYYIPCHDE